MTVLLQAKKALMNVTIAKEKERKEREVVPAAARAPPPLLTRCSGYRGQTRRCDAKARCVLHAAAATSR